MSFDYLKHIAGGLDKAALFEELMLTYGQDVWRYAYFITRRRDLAEDIAQEVFVKAFEHLETFRGGTSVKSWLLRITRNAALDHLKTAWMRRVRLLPGWMVGESRGHHPSAENEWLGGEAKTQVWRAVLELPRKQREALLLFAHYRLSLKEIAELLDIAEGTVKSRIFRARQTVGDRLAHLDGEGERSGEG